MCSVVLAMFRIWISLTVGLQFLKGCYGDADKHSCPDDGRLDHCTTGCCGEDEPSRNRHMDCCDEYIGLQLGAIIGISVGTSLAFVIIVLLLAYCYFKHKHRKSSSRSVSPELSDATYIDTNPYPSQGNAELFMFHVNTGRGTTAQSPPPEYASMDLAVSREDSVVTPPPPLMPLRSTQSGNGVSKLASPQTLTQLQDNQSGNNVSRLTPPQALTQLHDNQSENSVNRVSPPPSLKPLHNYQSDSSVDDDDDERHTKDTKDL